jgi:anthranilate/para-aminobenzoate synthase component II
MPRVLIIDFYDSFTYNIASTLYEMGIKSEVIGIDQLEGYPDHSIIILGPGPGRPEDYPEAIQLTKKLLLDKNKFIMGICLGHQMIWQIKGYDLVQSQNPSHGGQYEFRLPPWDCFDSGDWGEKMTVQRYNSLIIQIERADPDHLAEGAELLMGRFSNGLSYQFHPESVGTLKPQIFFAPLRLRCHQKLE